MRSCLILLILLESGFFCQTVGLSSVAIVNGAKILGRGIGMSLSRKGSSKFASVALSLLSDLTSGFGFKSFSGDNKENLKEISDSLKTIFEQQKQILEDIRKLSQKLEFIVTESVLADNERQIQNCIDSYFGLIKYPGSTVYTTQLKQCENIHSYVRSIGYILQGKQVSLTGKSIFRQLSTLYGYCNGRVLLKVYEYMFNLHFQGYCILLAAHQLNEKNESFIYINEYRDVLQEIERKMAEEMETCALQHCPAVQSYLLNHTELVLPDDILNTMNVVFPWYRFYIFMLKQGTDYNLMDISYDFGRFANKTDTGDITFLIFIKSTDSKIYTIQENLNLSVFNEIENPPTGPTTDDTFCEFLKIEVKEGNLISKTGEGISLTGLKSSGNAVYSLKSPCSVLQNKEKKSWNLLCKELKPEVNKSLSAHLNVWLIFLRSFSWVVFLAINPY